MKKIAIITTLALFAIAFMIWQAEKIESLKAANEKAASNQEILLSQNQAYKVSDSLNAMKASQLQLTLKEYEKYRSENLQVIEQLKIRGSDLEAIICAQLNTINSISSKLQDSLQVDSIYNVTDTLKCFSYSSKWCAVSGCIDLKNDSIKMQIKNNESLKIVETIKYKRFLGFLWKTKKVKDRQINVLSENPNTNIIKLDYIKLDL